MNSYFILPSSTHPKYILPIKSPAIFARSLELYTPYLLRKKLEINFLKGLSSMKLVRYCAAKRMIDSSNLLSIIPHGYYVLSKIKDEYKSNDIICAFYIGQSGKYVVQLMDNRAEILGYAKVCIKGITKEDNRNEYNTLLKISKKKFINFIVPRVRNFIETSDFSMLLLSPPGQVVNSCGLSIKQIHIEALMELFGFDIRITTLNQSTYISRIFREISSIQNDGRKKDYEETINIVNANFGDIPLLMGFCHYDFKPWNIRIFPDGRLYIYDWEMAREHWIPLWDYFHFILQPLILIKKKSGSLLERELLHPSSKIRPYMKKFGINDKIYLYLLMLYIIDLSIYCYTVDRIGEDREATAYVKVLHDFLKQLLKY